MLKCNGVSGYRAVRCDRNFLVACRGRDCILAFGAFQVINGKPEIAGGVLAGYGISNRQICSGLRLFFLGNIAENKVFNLFTVRILDPDAFEFQGITCGIDADRNF